MIEKTEGKTLRVKGKKGKRRSPKKVKGKTVPHSRLTSPKNLTS